MKKCFSFIQVLFLIILMGFSQHGIAQAKIKNIVLVHGFWADASSYSGIIEVLQAKGYNVLAPQLPLTSLTDDVAAVNDVLSALDGDCILVGHSYGGVVITVAGMNDKVKKLVYISALTPDEGESINTLLGKAAPTPAGQYFEVKKGKVWLKQKGFETTFAQDLPKIKADALYAVQKTPNASILGETTTMVAWKSKPSVFIISTKDLTINPDLQKLEAKRMNAKVVQVSGSHAAIVSKYKEVAESILKNID